MPGYHVACPFIVGDKIFVMSKPGDLICLRKRDGKVLWIGSTTYYDLLSDKDKRDNPALAKVAAEVEKWPAPEGPTGKPLGLWEKPQEDQVPAWQPWRERYEALERRKEERRKRKAQST